LVLETQRLILRPWTKEDAQFLYRYAKDPRVGPMAGWPVHTGLDDSRDIISEILSDPNTFAIVSKQVAHPIGSIGLMIGEESVLDLPEDEAEIGYWIGVPFWGRQLTPEAVAAVMRYGFKDLHLKKLWCGSLENNVRSIRVQEKCGFEYRFTQKDVFLPLINERHTQRIACLTKEKWQIEQH